MSNCTTTPFSYDVQYYFNSSCFTCNEACGTNIGDASCIAYTGPNLSCSGIETHDSVETALQKIDEQICTITGDYTGYQYNELPTWWGELITTEGEFVDAITAYALEVTVNLNNFLEVTFPAYQSSTDTRFTAIEEPGIVCSFAGVTSLDTLETVLTKYCTAFGTLNSSLSIIGVDWDQCFTVTTPPTTIAEAFSLVIDQICQVESAASALPTFNNTANCLIGTSTDSLVTTIGLITTKLCTTDAFDGGILTLGCIDPDSDSLQDVIQELITTTSTLVENVPTYSDDFIVTATSVGNPCAGKTISLATPINQDRFVAVDVGDVTPGTLSTKITAGTNITLDIVTTPGTMIVNSTGTVDSFKVKADSAGLDTEGYLINKINGASNTGISLVESYNSSTGKVDITPTIDATELFTMLLNQMDTDSELYELFCAKIANCPSPCDVPTDVQAVPVNTTSTTTILP